jgi:hypothetical protein
MLAEFKKGVEFDLFVGPFSGSALVVHGFPFIAVPGGRSVETNVMLNTRGRFSVLTVLSMVQLGSLLYRAMPPWYNSANCRWDGSFCHVFRFILSWKGDSENRLRCHDQTVFIITELRAD